MGDLGDAEVMEQQDTDILLRTGVGCDQREDLLLRPKEDCRRFAGCFVRHGEDMAGHH